MVKKNLIVKKFLNKILHNFKTSKKEFFKYGKEKCTYDAAYSEIKKINFFLKDYKKEKIAVFSEKSIGYYLSVISIILSGNTWIQFSNATPLNRIKEIIKFTNIKVGILDKSFNLKNFYKFKNLRLLKYDKIIKSKNMKSFTLSNINSTDIACIFFTSGSTGKPKGVLIDYLNLAESVNYQIKNLDYSREEIFADCHDTTFVMSICTIFPMLLLNCTISPLINLNDTIFPLDHIKKNKITTLITVPSFILYNKQRLQDLKIKNLILCGESFPYNILKLILTKIKFKNLYNCYGATELSPWAFSYKYKKKDYKFLKLMRKIPIGKAFRGVKSFVNEKNELCISGSVVSKGYLNNLKDTKEKFFSKNKEIFYNTGDLCIRKNNLYFIEGRNDSMVKIRGYRVDLNEIDNTIKVLSSINLSFSYLSGTNKKPYIVTVFNSENKKNISKIKKIIQINLPAYMIPKKIFQITKIPFNKNGKIDRIFLKKKYQ